MRRAPAAGLVALLVTGATVLAQQAKQGSVSAATRLAAEQGDVVAQHDLGGAYARGEGVPQNYAEAVTWFRRAAEQGHAAAQFALGVAYSHGEGVAQDYASAHMWANLAAAQGHADARRRRDALAAVMTPAQVAEAHRLAREWAPAPGDR